MPAVIRVTRRTARTAVETRSDFKGSNMFGQTLPNGVYAAFSYGPHWPMYVYKDGRWYGNSSRYSQSTSCQSSACHPFGVDITWLPVEDMLDLVK